jgi:sarcosine oxidase subunit beta
MRIADAVVIGGGVIGTSIAYHLARQGRKTVLVEKGGIGAATSGSCDKGVFLQSKKPGIHLELAKSSRALYENLEDELGKSFEFKRGGGMIVIETETQWEIMQSFVSQQQQAGVAVRLLDREEALAMQPRLASHIVGATWCPEDAEVNPLLLSQAFAAAAARLGAQILTHTEVTAICLHQAKVSGISTTNGQIAASLVINAAGPFAPIIGEMAGVPIPIRPRRGVIMISEKLPPVIKGNLLCAQYITAKHGADGRSGQRSPNPYGIGLSLGQTASGNLLIGGSREYRGFNRHIEADLLAAIADHARRIVPFLNDIRIIRTMVGFRPSTGDGLPILSPVPEIEGLYVAAGHEGDGIALAPITGRIMADMAGGGNAYSGYLPSLSLGRDTLHSNGKTIE